MLFHIPQLLFTCIDAFTTVSPTTFHITRWFLFFTSCEVANQRITSILPYCKEMVTQEDSTTRNPLVRVTLSKICNIGSVLESIIDEWTLNGACNYRIFSCLRRLKVSLWSITKIFACLLCFVKNDAVSHCLVRFLLQRRLPKFWRFRFLFSPEPWKTVKTKRCSAGEKIPLKNLFLKFSTMIFDDSGRFSSLNFLPELKKKKIFCKH